MQNMLKYYEDDTFDSITEPDNVKSWCYNYDAYMHDVPLKEILSKYIDLKEDIIGIFFASVIYNEKKSKLVLNTFDNTVYINRELIDLTNEFEINNTKINIPKIAKEYGIGRTKYVEFVEFNDGRTYNKVNGKFVRFEVVGE